MSASTPERGEIWIADLDPTLPGEQGGTRPVVVVSTSAFNRWPVGLVVVVPMTTRTRGFAHHVPVAGEGLERASFAMPEYVRSITARRLQQLLGVADTETMEDIGGWLTRIEGL